MEAFSESLTRYFLCKGFISKEQVPWCHYMIAHYAMNFISLAWLIPVGALVSGWSTSLAFVLSYRFLRSRTGGYHAKTPLGCMSAATAIQISALAILPHLHHHIATWAALLVFSALIIKLSPANNAELHLSAEEVQALAPRIKIRLLILWILVLGFAYALPEISLSIFLGIGTTALLLLLSKIGIGVK